MPKKKNTLIIVESPTKAKTISRFVGAGFVVKSSFGHIRDLPKRQLGIDVENNFEPKYVIPLKAKSVVSLLKKDAAKSERVILATDEDREGEAIAWHLAQALGLKEKKHRKVESEEDAKPSKSKTPEIQRITFDEITKSAIAKALENPRAIDQKLVDAQQARRVLDRLVGYKLSPLLWKKISKGLSAGRVQSVALRLIVDRERERQAFKPEEYWTVEAMLGKDGVTAETEALEDKDKLPADVFAARLIKKDGKTLDKFDVKEQKEAESIKTALQKTAWVVEEVAQKEVRRNPFPPFTTSTLQQTAGRRFGFSSKQTMRLAQMLYEGMDVGEGGSVGLITYMRTDSVNLSEESLQGALTYIENAFGKPYIEGAPRKYKTKSRLAQEAHEAIRPTDAARTPDSIKQYLEPRAWKLYDLIWRRFVASQMPPARFLETDILISAGAYTFNARGLVKQFDGYQRVYAVKTKDVTLPMLAKNDMLSLLKLSLLQHFTEPPARFNESSLIKTLEEYGIGRPSTYAPTISVIQDRGYVQKDEKRSFLPTEVGCAVNDLLAEHFPLTIDVQFTAKMEENLDKVAAGTERWQDVIREFYTPFAKLLGEKQETITKMVEQTNEVCEKCGKPMIIRMGRFGRFMACSGFPDCKNAKPIPGSEPVNFGVSTGQEGAGGGDADEKCEKCGAGLVRRQGRFGPFFGCSRYPECNYIKKKNYSIGMKCPKCFEGDVVTRRTKARRIFYGCSRYPECDYATWVRPEPAAEAAAEPAAKSPSESPSA
ncbi:MAG: type I DNA topoisomerase [bacterium]|nr:type I DNA topoisomerase [bacterium]